jgi:hypothetical protein
MGSEGAQPGGRGVFGADLLRYRDVVVAPITSPQAETVAWVRELNSRWIVHHGLEQRAAAYLAHLEATDPERLTIACERAAHLVRACGLVEDPKPWFYAGLFSVATLEEAGQYLAGHWFTAECVPSLAGQSRRYAPLQGVGPATEAKIARVRKAISELD